MYTDPVPLVACLSVFLDTCLPSIDHMKNIAHRVSAHLSNRETQLYTHVNELLSTTVSVFYWSSTIIWTDYQFSIILLYQIDPREGIIKATTDYLTTQL